MSIIKPAKRRYATATGANIQIKKKKKIDRKLKPLKAGEFRSKFEQTFWEENSPRIPMKYEPFKMPFKVESTRIYKPDFVVNPRAFPHGSIVFETKGYFRPEDRSKMRKVKKSYPDLRIVMVFMQDNFVSKSKTMRYSDWCIKHGFDYLIGTDINKIVPCFNTNLHPKVKRRRKIKEESLGE